MRRLLASCVILVCLMVGSCAVLLIGAAAAHCEALPPDPLAVKPLAQVWLGAQSTYAPGAARKDVAVGQVSLIAGFGRWGAGARIRTMGAVGAFRPDQPATFAAAEGYVLAWRNLLALQGGISVGPAAFAGYAIPLQEQDGKAPRLARACTAMGGLRLSGPSWRAELGIGIYQQLPGVSVGATVHVDMSEHSAWIVDLAAGAPTSNVTTCVTDPKTGQVGACTTKATGAVTQPYVASIALVLRP